MSESWKGNRALSLGLSFVHKSMELGQWIKTMYKDNVEKIEMKYGDSSIHCLGFSPTDHYRHQPDQWVERPRLLGCEEIVKEKVKFTTITNTMIRLCQTLVRTRWVMVPNIAVHVLLHWILEIKINVNHLYREIVASGLALQLQYKYCSLFTSGSAPILWFIHFISLCFPRASHFSLL